MAKSKEVTVAGEHLPVETTRPSFMGDTARGQENVGTDDITIPRLDVIQSLSPQRKKNDPAYIEGAEEGLLFNTVSGELYGKSVIFVPVFFRKEFVVWKDRKSGGGFNGAFSTKAEAEAHATSLGEDFEVQDTAQQFGLIWRPESTPDNPVLEEIVISMAKSKMKVSRQLNTMCKMAGGDRFERAYEISSAHVEGTKGEYESLVVKPLGFVNEPVYRAAEKLYEAISSGQRDVNREYEGESTDSSDREY
ncbi:MAG: hypothetical protein DWQ49_09835 [Bacteroidetes bacterium]|nr:MAG: hypothetical protein DWQ49_09835 [Bacteroidota bacterium]